MGVLHMVPMIIKGTERYGNIISVDLQAKTKNMYDWGWCFPSGFNNNNKLQNFCNALTLVEDDRWYAFVVCLSCEISGRPLESIQIISADMKLSEPLFRSYLSGKDYVACHCNQIMLHRF